MKMPRRFLLPMLFLALALGPACGGGSSSEPMDAADLPDAVETLEATADVHEEIEKVARSLEGLRRWLVEIMLLENAAQRAAEAVTPLTELSDLRRLSPSEMRQAVQSVVQSRRGHTTPSVPEVQPAAEITKAPTTLPPLDSVPRD